MKSSSSSVSVVVPTRNNLAELTECLASLQSQRRVPTRALVCVDGSTDGTVEHLAAVGDHGPVAVHVLTHPENTHRGRAATRNLALDHIDTEWIWYVDSDMVLAPDALDQHLSLVEHRACTSQGQVLYKNADVASWAGYLQTRAHHRAANGAVIPFRWYSAANSLVRAHHVRRLGGFDASLVGYGGEDFEFAYRLERLSGEPFVYNALAVAVTAEHKSIEQSLAQFDELGANLHHIEQRHPEYARLFGTAAIGVRTTTRTFRSGRLFTPRSSASSTGPSQSPRVRLRNMLLNYKVVAAVSARLRFHLALLMVVTVVRPSRKSTSRYPRPAIAWSFRPRSRGSSIASSQGRLMITHVGDGGVAGVHAQQVIWRGLE